MSETVRLKYTGATPGADANTYSIFDTVTAFPGANYLPSLHMKRLMVSMAHNQAGTLNWYETQSRQSTSSGTTWTQIGTLAVAAPAANTADTFDFLVEEYQDFKLEWVNGGVAQNPWLVDVALTDERNKSS